MKFHTVIVNCKAVRGNQNPILLFFTILSRLRSNIFLEIFCKKIGLLKGGFAQGIQDLV